MGRVLGKVQMKQDHSIVKLIGPNMSSRYKTIILPMRDLTFVPRLQLMILSGLVLLAYANSLKAPFVFDDFHVIVYNRNIQDLKAFFSSPFWLRPRFLVDATFALQWYFFGKNVFPYHIFNLLIHLANTLLAYGLTITVQRILQSRISIRAHSAALFPLFAFAATAVFAIHPIQTQAVTYIAQRYTAMMATFYLGSLWTYLIFRENHRPGYGVLACLAAGLAFLCKQTALTLPLTIAVIEIILFAERHSFWREHIFWVLAVGLLAVGVLLFHLGFFPRAFVSWEHFVGDLDRASRETALVPRLSYFFTQLRVLCLYLGLLLFPARQCLDYRYPFTHSFFEGWTPLAAVLLILLLAVAWKSRRRFPLVSLGIGFFFTTLALESSFIPIRDAAFEHRLYLAVLGYGWIFFSLVHRLCTVRPMLAATAGVSALIVFLLATHMRNEVWADPIALWREAAERNPRNARAYNNLGRLLLDAGRFDEAHAYLEQSLQLDPLRPNVHFNLGLSYARRGLYADAAQSFSAAVMLQPDNAKFHYNLGLAFQNTGKTEAARQAYEAAHILDRELTEPALNLAAIAYHENRYDEAQHILQNLARQEPSNPKIFLYLSLVRQAQGHLDEALKDLENGLQLEPQDFELRRQKAALLIRLHKPVEARLILQSLHEERPHDSQVTFWLATLKSANGHED